SAHGLTISRSVRSLRRQWSAKLVERLSGRSIAQHRERSHPVSLFHQLANQLLCLSANSKFPDRPCSGHNVRQWHSQRIPRRSRLPTACHANCSNESYKTSERCISL